MKKIFLLLFLIYSLFLITFSSNAWEINEQSNIPIDCINENLDPCSSLKASSNKSEIKVVKEKNVIYFKLVSDPRSSFFLFFTIVSVSLIIIKKNNTNNNKSKISNI